MKWNGHEARTGKVRKFHNILVRIPQGKKCLRDVGVYGMILKRNLNKV